MLELLNGYKSYKLPSGGTLDVLRNVSIKVSPGESLAILGRSGSGKSTLLGLLGLLDSLDDGSYMINGVETVGMSDWELAKLRGDIFGFIYQRFCLMGHLSVFQNVEAPLLHRQGGRVYRQRLVVKALDMVGITKLARHKPDQLSGGEQQRVAIARALVHNPSVIIANEPTGSLDQSTGNKILELMLDLVKNMSVMLVLVTHDPNIAARLQRTFKISEGVIKGS